MVLHPGGGAGGAKGQGVNVLAMGLGEMEYVAPFRNQSRYTSRKTDGQFDLCSFYFEPEYDVCFGLSPLLSACAPLVLVLLLLTLCLPVSLFLASSTGNQRRCLIPASSYSSRSRSTRRT